MARLIEFPVLRVRDRMFPALRAAARKHYPCPGISGKYGRDL